MFRLRTLINFASLANLENLVNLVNHVNLDCKATETLNRLTQKKCLIAFGSSSSVVEEQEGDWVY